MTGSPRPCRDLLPRLLQPLVHELPREVDVRPLLEVDVDDGEPEVATRSGPRSSPGRPFIATSTGYVTSCSTSSGASPSVSVNTCTSAGRDVRVGVHRQSRVGPRARRRRRHACRHEHEQPLAEGEVDQLVDHRRPLSARGRRTRPWRAAAFSVKAPSDDDRARRDPGPPGSRRCRPGSSRPGLDGLGPEPAPGSPSAPRRPAAPSTSAPRPGAHDDAALARQPRSRPGRTCPA